ncbi:cytochrome ubiquinol oxidase subunit I [Kitasatospora sp. RB6PN24]|uniref:cytochrome ubiquinol oxidase subunit I n=1 Tax=Kitasatospora humi TaxID=2893891 RepID=UPI001E50985B|nr:cytochrome ubiquinol oxidase subunit I [Kitasatospora humi]MCC9310104.1 cytochrome ubiquinol oxidase subunit I [Kitasatospora humi]
MDPLLLARLQFALTTSFHFLFVTLTLGLALLLAVMETRYVRTGDETYARMTKFWGQIYIVNYAMGIVTGIVMEFQFGLNWNGLGHTAGNVFGAPLAMETLVAFFAESTFLGMWIFGWDRLPRKVHLTLMWLVTLTAFLSAYWIMVANGWLHHPVGYVMRGGEAHVTDFAKLLTNPFTLVAFGHIAAGALITAGVFLAGISGYHLRRKKTAEADFFRRSLRIGVITAGIGLLPSIGLGVVQFILIRYDQPSKDAAFNNDPAQIAQTQAEMVHTYGPGHYIPPTAAVENSGDTMMYIWVLVTLVVVTSLFMLRRGRLFRSSRIQRVLTWTVPLPFIANIAGWLFREIGRQPWAVYGLLRTDQASSHISAGWVTASLIGFVLLFLTLATVDYTIIARYSRRGPDRADLGATESDATPEPVIAF